MQTNNNKQQNKEVDSKPKRPLTRTDFETVLKAATKPLKQEQGEKESEGT